MTQTFFNFSGMGDGFFLEFYFILLLLKAGFMPKKDGCGPHFRLSLSMTPTQAIRDLDASQIEKKVIGFVITLRHEKEGYIFI